MHVGTMHVGTMHVGTMHVGTMHAGLYSNNVRGINILGGVDSGFLFQISPGSNAYPAARQYELASPTQYELASLRSLNTENQERL